MLAFALTIFIGAFLLFQVQPLIGKYILPWFGGTPAVWTTCMLFFQMLLLAGYSYSHLLISRLSPRTQRSFQITVLLSAVVLVSYFGAHWGTPILPSAAWKPSAADNPV